MARFRVFCETTAMKSMQVIRTLTRKPGVRKSNRGTRSNRYQVCFTALAYSSYHLFLFQIAEHDRDMTLVTQILWGRTTHVSVVGWLVGEEEHVWHARKTERENRRGEEK